MMPVLFVGLGLPAVWCEYLAALVPPDDVRIRRLADFHLTLHYLGPGRPEIYQDALAVVQAAAFELVIGGPGCFLRRDGACILWMGVATNRLLETLHRRAGEALAVAGFTPDRRPFAPHVTVARCSPGFSRAALRRFMDQPRPKLPAATVSSFQLYCRGPAPPYYQVVARFALQGG